MGEPLPPVPNNPRRHCNVATPAFQVFLALSLLSVHLHERRVADDLLNAAAELGVRHWQSVRRTGYWAGDGSGETPRGRAATLNAVVHRPGEGERIGGGPTTVTIKATGKDTDDSFYLGEATLEPGFAGPPPHVHERLHDMFYVLEGTLTMRLGDDTTELAKGSFVCVPPGVVHTFGNPGPRRVRLLNFNTPAGWENYMRDLGAALEKGTPSPEEIGQIASRYDFRVV